MDKTALKLKSKKGSVIVLIALLLIALVTAISAIYEAAGRSGAVSMAEQALDIAGRSVLSCYDLELEERYEIFGVEMKGKGIKNTLNYMVSQSLETSRLAGCRIDDINIELTSFSLTQPDNLRSQIVEIEKERAILDNIDELAGFMEEIGGAYDSSGSMKDRIQSLKEDMEAAEEAQREDDSDDDSDRINFAQIRRVHRQLESIIDEETDDRSQAGNAAVNRTLRNKRIINTLPSAVNGVSSGGVFAGTGAFAGDSSLDSILVDEYIMAFFGNHLEASNQEESFFSNEAEYVLYGGGSDEDNYRRALLTIRGIRQVLNTAYIYSDHGKRTAALEAAETLTPGPFAVLTQLLIISAWAAVETSNDIKNLEAGNGVPLIKNDETFMIDLGSVTAGSDRDFIEIPGNSIMTYPYYLRIILLTEKLETRLYRIMDLIQINMKGSSRQEFTLADHYCGFSVSAVVRRGSDLSLFPAAAADLSQVHTYISN